MRVRVASLLLGLLGLAAPGCMVADATHVVAHSSAQCLDDARERRRNARWAEQAWEQVAATCPAAFSPDHACGFKEGFAELLYTGRPDPPPLPPSGYRTVRFQTPEGYRAIEDWFAGYRHGASVALASGYRQFITGPSSLRQPLSTAGAPVGAPDQAPAPTANGLGPPVLVPGPAEPVAEAPTETRRKLVFRLGW